MLFSSLFFICIFLPVTLIIYYAVPWKFKNFVLLILSLVFYAWGEPVYVILMMFSIVFNYMAGIQMGDFRKLKNERRRKIVFIFTVAVNLGMLGFFKYFDFLIGSINGLFGANIPLKNIALPIGISFYTFQILSYVIDVYWGKVPVQKNIISFGAYITMFPQLIAGPIVRYEDIMSQLKRRTINIRKIADGAAWFIKGLSKKVLLANNIGMLFDSISAIDASERAVTTTWLMVAAFALQIYFDFSGYSDMAVGLGKMMGFEFVQNFDHPFTSMSAAEFWRRWHISLGTWFREYVYIPLGGNRCSALKNMRNLMVVWVLTGLWHGAAWNFILWGAFFGVMMILEKYVIGNFLERLPRALRHLYAAVVTFFSWILFSAPSTAEIGRTIVSGTGGYGNAFIDSTTVYFFMTNLVLIIICILCSTPLVSNLFKALCRNFGTGGEAAGAICYCLMLVVSMAFLVNDTYNPFLYFRF
ncbi:MAG: MBOAT family protein [Parasporobacterium sp.]|nr:MBOAT family protein [Parasporobacterium sp.]